MSSPQQRAIATAVPIAARHGLQAAIDAAADELDYGAWTGRTIEELAPEPDWQRWNEARSTSAIPGGESMVAAQVRMVELALRLARRHPDGEVAIIGHQDPLKALVMHWLGMALDGFMRFELDPASLSIVRLVSPASPRLLLLNGSVPPRGQGSASIEPAGRSDARARPAWSGCGTACG